MIRLELAIADGAAAAAVRVERRDELGRAAEALGLPAGAPTTVVVGGAGNMAAADAEQALEVLRHVVAPLVQRIGGVVVDGGTDVGVMRAAGVARAMVGASFPLVGVVVERLVRTGDRGDDPDGARLDPRHTHFVLVPGANWGDEAAWLAALATAIARGGPSATLLLNGGEIARRDLELSLDEQRPVVVVAGTGRIADEIAARSTPTARTLAGSPRVHVASSDRLEELHGVLATLLDARAGR